MLELLIVIQSTTRKGEKRLKNEFTNSVVKQKVNYMPLSVPNLKKKHCLKYDHHSNICIEKECSDFTCQFETLTRKLFSNHYFLLASHIYIVVI